MFIEKWKVQSIEVYVWKNSADQITKTRLLFFLKSFSYFYIFKNEDDIIMYTIPKLNSSDIGDTDYTISNNVLLHFYRLFDLIFLIRQGGSALKETHSTYALF